jgi:hypothetical protein
LNAWYDHSVETNNNSKTAKEKTMKKYIWKPLQITWLVVALFAAQSSIQALKSEASYCSGMYCESTSDCGVPCFCDSVNFMCYNPPQPES